MLLIPFLVLLRVLMYYFYSTLWYLLIYLYHTQNFTHLMDTSALQHDNLLSFICTLMKLRQFTCDAIIVNCNIWLWSSQSIGIFTNLSNILKKIAKEICSNCQTSLNPPPFQKQSHLAFTVDLSRKFEIHIKSCFLLYLWNNFLFLRAFQLKAFKGSFWDQGGGGG